MWYRMSLPSNFVQLRLKRFIFAAEQCVVGLSCYYPRTDQGGCWKLDFLATGVCRQVDHYCFVSIFLWWGRRFSPRLLLRIDNHQKLTVLLWAHSSLVPLQLCRR